MSTRHFLNVPSYPRFEPGLYEA